MSYLPRDDDPATQGTRRRGAQHHRRPARPLLRATALGTLVPGLGLALTGRRRLGWPLIGSFIVGRSRPLPCSLVRNGLVRTALQPGGPAQRAGRRQRRGRSSGPSSGAPPSSGPHGSPARAPDRGQQLATAAFTILMCLVVLAPPRRLVRYVTIQRDVVGSLFSSGKHVAPSAAGVDQAKPQRHQGRPVGRHAPGQRPAARLRRRRRPHRGAHRLDDGGQHQHQDRRHRPVRCAPQPAERARSPSTTRCTSSTPRATTAGPSA